MWYQVSGIRLSGIWYHVSADQVSGIWYQIPGSRYQETDGKDTPLARQSRQARWRISLGIQGFVSQTLIFP